jgi:Recombination endonuclease VII/NUMOD3 motif
MTHIRINMGRGQKKGFRHTEETKNQISQTLKGKRPSGFTKIAYCPECNQKMTVSNVPKHVVACRKLSRYRHLFDKPITTREFKAFVVRIRLNYGMSIDEYADLSKQQKGLCAICEKTPQGKRPLGIDHCHATGKARELLCSKCNVLIGYSSDSVDILEKAIAYLKKHSFVDPFKD